MLKIQAEANVPTQFGVFRMIAFAEDPSDWTPHLALIAEGTDLNKPVNVRFHSECITGETFHSHKCECGLQLDAAMDYAQRNGGIIIYLRQEGRSIGIINKLKAYALQEEGLDTVEANLRLGLDADSRSFAPAIEILNILGVKEVKLITNNPQKIKAVEDSNIRLVERVALKIEAYTESQSYLQTKRDYFGHLLDDKNI